MEMGLPAPVAARNPRSAGNARHTEPAAPYDLRTVECFYRDMVTVMGLLPAEHDRVALFSYRAGGTALHANPAGSPRQIQAVIEGIVGHFAVGIESTGNQEAH